LNRAEAVLNHPAVRGLETPAAIVDWDLARANAERVVAYGRRHGIAWRPHIKTHKCREVARLQLTAGAQGLTVATPREAEVMSTVSDDILLAYPVVGESKLNRLMALPEEVRLTVGLDSAEVLDGVAGAARPAGRTTGVLIEVDVGMGRVGLPTISEAVMLAARARDTEGVEYRGIMFYPGHIRVEPDRQDEGIRQVAAFLTELFSALGCEGLAPEIVSGGSTPTLWRSHEMPGLTEIRAGTAIYFDHEGEGLGVTDHGSLAYTVLATVVSTSIEGQAVVDAGSKAIAKEGRARDGFGSLYEHPEVHVKAVSEEHGVLDLTDTSWRPRIGERVRIVPNHVCVSVNLQDAIYAFRDGALARLELEARGRGHFEDRA
jgi:D-serine deaminase-like pyridoxal phosphate-dependent protein